MRITHVFIWNPHDTVEAVLVGIPSYLSSKFFMDVKNSDLRSNIYTNFVKSIYLHTTHS